MAIHLILCHPVLVKVYLFNPFEARAPDDQSFNPLSTNNITMVFKLTHLLPLHLKIIHLILCNPEYVNGFHINPFVAGPHNDHSVDSLYPPRIY